MVPLLLLALASSVGSAGPRPRPLPLHADAARGGRCAASAPPAVGDTWGAHRGLPGALRLRGGGRAWVRKTVKAASKKERQRKKRNIDSTNLRASVKLDPGAVPPGLLLQNELEHQAIEWVLGGCRPEALPTVEPLKAIAEARQRLLVEPGKPLRVPPRAIQGHQEEDAKMQDGGGGGGGGGEEQFQNDVGSRGSRAVPKSKSSHVKLPHLRQKGAGKRSDDTKRSSGKRSGLRLRGGAPSIPDEDSSSVVSDDTSSVLSSSSSSSFALAKASPPAAPATAPAASPASTRPPAGATSRCVCVSACFIAASVRVRACVSPCACASVCVYLHACVSMCVRACEMRMWVCARRHPAAGTTAGLSVAGKESAEEELAGRIRDLSVGSKYTCVCVARRAGARARACVRAHAW